MLGQCPNITGWAQEGVAYYFHNKYRGALKIIENTNGESGWTFSTAGRDKAAEYFIDASLDNTIYSGNTVQPPALQALIIIKV